MFLTLESKHTPYPFYHIVLHQFLEEVAVIATAIDEFIGTYVATAAT